MCKNSSFLPIAVALLTLVNKLNLAIALKIERQTSLLMCCVKKVDVSFSLGCPASRVRLT